MRLFFSLIKEDYRAMVDAGMFKHEPADIAVLLTTLGLLEKQINFAANEQQKP